jgi:primase-polymerase (primpol)-like protein
MTLAIGALPDDLIELDSRWGLWRPERVNGRVAKVPYSITGHRASTTNPSDWASWPEASRAFSRTTGRYAGLAFLFDKSDGISGIDLDDVLDSDGRVKPWGAGVVERFGDTYTEISPSGTGLKIWARGALPANLPGVRVGDGSIEMYDHARYFTVTGRVFPGTPLQVEDHASDLLCLHNRLTSGAQKVWPLQPLNGGRIPHGQQHHTLVSIAGTLRARRVCDEAILACLLAVNAHQCERPGSPEAISRIVRSTRAWATK